MPMQEGPMNLQMSKVRLKEAPLRARELLESLVKCKAKKGRFLSEEENRQALWLERRKYLERIYLKRQALAIATPLGREVWQEFEEHRNQMTAGLKQTKKPAKPPVETRTLLEEFRALLAEAPLDFVGTGDRASARAAEKDFSELVAKFEQRLQDVVAENEQYRAKEYDRQQAGEQYD